MATRFLSITPLQEPFDLGELDDSGRRQCVFNVLARKEPSATFLRELVAILEEAGVGKLDIDIFASTGAVLVRGDGPFLFVKATGGSGPVGTHNGGAGATRRPGAQLVAKASTWEAAEALAQAAYSALVAVTNRLVEVPA